VGVVPWEAQWNDIGSWTALYDIGVKDDQGNVIKGDVITQDTTNTYVNANHHMVVTIGVDNLIVVDTADAILIATQDKALEVQSIVSKLNDSNRDEGGLHRKVYRPWGWYDSIELGLNYQVKRLHIKIGAKLSLQMHQKRAEHWIVIKGLATVVNGKSELALNVGESTYIPPGVVHSLENKTSELLEVIEIQSGAYLGEDDIERFEDIYNRID
jgi:mannose-1-phosphate guanylyltransferase/mannose-6-phosphate isomerase